MTRGSDPVGLMPFDPTDVPIATDLGPWPPARVAGLLRAGRDLVTVELTALGDELAGWRPAPDEWSANECVGHLVEADRRGFAGRIGRIIETDGVAEEDWDQVGVAAARRDWVRPVAAVVEDFRIGREAGIALVEGLRADQLSRAAIHARVGRITISDLLQEWVFHDRNHIRQLLANTQARAWPVMGNTRRFSRADS
jgi:DinB family protein